MPPVDNSEIRPSRLAFESQDKTQGVLLVVF